MLLAKTVVSGHTGYTLLPVLLEPARITGDVLLLLVTLLLLSTEELVKELELGRRCDSKSCKVKKVEEYHCRKTDQVD